MSRSLLMAAALGGWLYAGFVDEPGRPKPTPPAGVPEFPPDWTPDPPPAPAPTGPPAPTRYRLADAAGQVWEHTDPAFLSSWVADRNRSLGRP